MPSEGGQQHKRARDSEEELDEAPVTPDTEQAEKLADDVDAILDQIDEVLEENAEDFVRGFVQKGGQ